MYSQIEEVFNLILGSFLYPVTCLQGNDSGPVDLRSDQKGTSPYNIYIFK